MATKELQISFKGRGEVRDYLFTQLEMSEKAYLYQVHSEQTMHYEVFKRRINTQFNCVSYPSSKSFGIWAWCMADYDKAKQKFEELSNE